MEAIIFIGIQGSGKSTYYKERYFQTHMRINLDMLKTRRREDLFLETCIRARQRFVVDNTNPTVEQRAKYIRAARNAGFKVIACFFDTSPELASSRNSDRLGRWQVPEKAIFATYRKLELPRSSEGFDEIYYINPDPSGHG